MHANNFTLEQYFKRIGFNGQAKAEIETIAQIMRCQLFTVPFENLDVQAGKVVSLNPEEIADKILYQNRGGYCYEVNGIFAMLLTLLNIPYYFVAARPMFYPVKRPKTHMAIVFKLNNIDWLCDLGFGSYGLRSPMRLDFLDAEVKQDDDTFLLTKTNDQEFLLKALVEDEWLNQFAFNLYPQEWIDFAPANYLNSTHPEAIFVQKLLIVLHNASGRKILFGDKLKVIHHGQVQVQHIAPENISATLALHFRLNLPDN